MADLSGFDASKHDDMKSFRAIPEGEYPMQIISSEKKVSKNNSSSSYLNLVAEVISGEHKGHQVYMVMNLWNVSDKATEIANQELATLCRALGITGRLKQSELLHKIPFIGTVVVRPAEGKYPESNGMDGYKPYDASKAASPIKTNITAPTSAGGGLEKPWEKKERLEKEAAEKKNKSQGSFDSAAKEADLVEDDIPY